MVCIKCTCGKNMVSEEEAQVYATSELGQDHNCYIFEFAEVHILDQFLKSSNEFQEMHCGKINACNLKKVHQRDGSTKMVFVHLSGQINWFVPNIDDDRTFEKIAKHLVVNFRKCLPGKKIQRRHQEEQRSHTAREQFLDKILHEDCK